MNNQNLTEIIEYKSTEPQRLDRFIFDYFHSKNPDLSRRFFQIAIKNQEIKVNDKPVNPNHKLRLKDEIKIDIKKLPQVDLEIKAEKNIKFAVIFEHPDFLIINKPAGISTHSSKNEPGGTLVNGLLDLFPKLEKIGEDKLRPGIVHRLDKETSGILIVAKTQESFEYFKNLFQNRKVQKTYLAWVWGILKNKSGEIKEFTGKSRQNPTKQAVSHNPDKLINPKTALTKYRVLEELTDRSLLELKPKTGRKHQLRLHLHSIGHPILGDKKYFNKTIKKNNQVFARHLLHAKKIEFKYSNNESFCFEAPLPSDFEMKNLYKLLI